MPIFKTNNDIFKTGGEETFDENIMNYDFLIFPETKKWDYKKPLSIEDIEIWEVLYEEGGGTGVYAAWRPYAEFYMVSYKYQIEIFTGFGCNLRLTKYLNKKNIPFLLKTIWVEDDEIIHY